jgi:transcriptional regulator of acetoin/glycerol metabolism
MTWAAVLEVIAQEAGQEIALRIEERVRDEFGGMNLYIRRTQEITRHDLDAVAPGRPKEAARKLGIHPATAYRILRQPIIR